MMNKILYLIVILCVLTTCKKGQAYVLSKNEAHDLEKRIEQQLYYDSFCYNDVYFLDKSNILHKATLVDIVEWYKLIIHEQYRSLGEYIYIVFNQKLGENDSITINSMDTCCKIDTSVLEIYRTKKISGIMEKYCTYDSVRKSYKLNREIFGCEKETISYLFFINRYTKSESDYVYSVSYRPFSLSGNLTK